MEQDEIISRAVRIVKNNNKYHKSVLSGFFDDSVGARSSPFGGGPSSSSPEKYDLYFVKTDQKDFYVENSENYNIDISHAEAMNEFYMKDYGFKSESFVDFDINYIKI